MYRSELKKDIDDATKRWTFAIRGLREVATDEKGKEMIVEGVKSMRSVYNHLLNYIADLEADNMQLNLRLQHDSEIKMEHRLLKLVNEMNMEIDKTGQMLKELLTKNK